MGGWKRDFVMTFQLLPARVAWGCLALAILPAAWAAEAFVPPKTPATLTITYTLTGSGEDLPSSKERHITWSVDDRYEFKTTLQAQEPSGTAYMNDAALARQGADAQRMQAAMAANGNDPAMIMQKMQQIKQQCGNDSKCMNDAITNMTGVNPNPGPPRYQMFSIDGLTNNQSGTYRIAEKSREAYFAAACSLKREAKCAIDSGIQGEGPLTDAQGKTPFTVSAGVEFDAEQGTLTFLLPPPGFAKAKKTVASRDKGRQSGDSEVVRRLPGGFYREKILVTCGACQSATGTLTRQIKDEHLGRPATLKIDWQFSRP